MIDREQVLHVARLARLRLTDEELDQPDLVGGRDHLGLVLKPVARADLADADRLGQLAHAREVRRRNVVTTCSGS